MEVTACLEVKGLGLGEGGNVLKKGEKGGKDWGLEKLH